MPRKQPNEVARMRTSHTEHDLEESLPYLLNRAGVRIADCFSHEIAPLRVSLGAWRVCASLHKQDHQRLSDLAAHTSIDVSTLSRMVAGLMTQGWVQRERSSNDARALQLSLTASGHAMVESIIPLAQWYERLALAGLDPGQAASLKVMLKHIFRNFSAIPPRKST